MMIVKRKGRRAGALIAGFFVLVAGVSAAASLDTDGDTISDADEGPATLDTDSDKTPDYLDTDSDGDGIPDSVEAGDSLPGTLPVDTDLDKTPDFQDVDSDDDSVPDAVEDANGNGTVDKGETSAKSPDSDGDGLKDGQEDKNFDGAVDPGECNPLDPDTDGDKIKDGSDKCCASPEDLDGLKDTDGCPEDDADEDKVKDIVEQGHACLDPLKPDTDGDGLEDGQEDTNFDGLVDPTETDPCKKDTDGDGINDDIDKCPLKPEDFDGYQDRDGCPESNTDGGLDAGPEAGREGGIIDPNDRDGDKLSDGLEMSTCTDYLNPDSDGDGRGDGDEDANHNGKVDEGETDPCTPNVDPRGGAGCTVSSPGQGWPTIIVLLGMMVLLRTRRRK